MNENNQNGSWDNQQPDQGQPNDPNQYRNTTQQPYGPGGQPPYQQPPVSPPPYQQPPTPPYVQYNSEETIKLFCILAYIPLLWLVGLIAERENPKVKFHVNQGIILTIFTVICSVAVSLLKGFISIIFTVSSFGTGFFTPLGALINGLLSLAAFLLFVAFAVTGILHAAQGREEPLPIIGNAFHIIK